MRSKKISTIFSVIQKKWGNMKKGGKLIAHRINKINIKEKHMRLIISIRNYKPVRYHSSPILKYLLNNFALSSFER